LTGQVDPERRLRCLTLGTYAQAVIERLARPAGQRLDDLSPLIADTLEAVKEINEHGWPKTSCSGLRPFRYYDQVKILSILSQAEEAAREALEKLRQEPNSNDEEAVQTAMRFFRELAREALRQSHFSLEEAATSFRA